MRHAGRIVADVLALMEEELRPGITTAHLDSVAEEYISKSGARPSFKGYRGYPASICVSIDDEIVHGIPGPRLIEEGQVVSTSVSHRIGVAPVGLLQNPLGWAPAPW